MVLPKIKDKIVEECLAYHQVLVNFIHPEDPVNKELKPLNLYNCFLRFGPMLHLH